MCLQAQGINNNDGGLGRVIRARGISNNNEGVGRGRGIYDTSEGTETTTEAVRIMLRRRRLRRRDDRPD